MQLHSLGSNLLAPEKSQQRAESGPERHLRTLRSGAPSLTSRDAETLTGYYSPLSAGQGFLPFGVTADLGDKRVCCAEPHRPDQAQRKHRKGGGGAAEQGQVLGLPPGAQPWDQP